jgi:hypothetical protein
MAIKKVKLPNNTTQDINDARVVSDAITYIGSEQGTATYVDGGQTIDVSTKADKVSNATNGNFAGLDSNGNLIDSGHKHSDYQAALVSGTNIKTINNQSLLGSGNITISGGSGGISDVTLGGSSVVSNNVAVLPAYPTTLPASDVSSWAKASTKPTYTASEVGALPDTTTIPTESTVAGWGFTKNAGTITGINMNGASKGTSGVVDLGTVVTSESDPVFTASAAHGISSTDISNWNAKQKAITVSSSEPTSSQGSNGDIWIVI